VQQREDWRSNKLQNKAEDPDIDDARAGVDDYFCWAHEKESLIQKLIS
jgi:hypothetical protein